MDGQSHDARNQGIAKHPQNQAKHFQNWKSRFPQKKKKRSASQKIKQFARSEIKSIKREGMMQPVNHTSMVVVIQVQRHTVRKHRNCAEIPLELCNGLDIRPDMAERTALSASSTSFWKSSTGGFGEETDREERLEGSECTRKVIAYCIACQS